MTGTEEIVPITKKFLPGKDAKVDAYILFDEPLQGYVQYKHKGIYNMKLDHEIVNDGFIKYERYIVSLHNGN